jgi:hypothetical protein
MAIAVAQTGRLPSGGPGPAHVGDEQKAALIDEDEMGATSCGVFLSVASVLFHRAMAASSRSTARRSGFWQLQPSAVRIFQTWLGW